MTIINAPIGCTTGPGNTAIPSCGATIDHLKGLFLCFDGFEIPNASLTSFANVLTYLQIKTLAANPLERLYPLSIIEGLTNNTAAPEKKNSGYGNTQYTAEQPHQFELELENVGIEFFKRLRKWNGRKDLKVYWIDTEFIGGHQTSTGFAPIEASLFVKQAMPGNIADYTKYMADLELKNPKSLTDLLDTIAIPDGTDLESEVNGITDVTLAGTGGVLSATVTGLMSISKENFITKFRSSLAGVSFLVDGVAKAPTSISAQGVALLTLTAGVHTVSLVAPSAIAAVGIGSSTAGGYESNEITVTVRAT